MAVREFDRFAATYGEYNIIQRKAVETLLDWVEERELGRVLDLGCGTGELCRKLTEKALHYDHFVGVDLSPEMLAYHPRNERIELLQLDFNDTGALRALQSYGFDTLFSSSALQWSRDPDRTLEALSTLGGPAYFSIFTSSTFRTLLRTAGRDSPIHSAELMTEALKKHYRISRLERIEYQLSFESVLEMFRYIKRSGVSGGEGRLSYLQTRKLMESYPLDYLEFELIFCRAEPKGR